MGDHAKDRAQIDFVSWHKARRAQRVLRRLLLLQGMDSLAAAQRIRLPGADSRFSQTKALISLAEDLGANLPAAPAPAPTAGQPTSVALALADVVDAQLQHRCPELPTAAQCPYITIYSSTQMEMCRRCWCSRTGRGPLRHR